jgi:AGZA family xanthine/uracil permease-like MFS transporter
MLHRLFRLREQQTTVWRELSAGLVTFMTMAYIIFVNPSILANAMGQEMVPAVAVATCLAAGLMTIAMGLVANYPLALASGMGLNAFLTFTVVLGMNVPWQTAMGIVFVEGLLVTLLVLTNIRQWVMDAIPLDLKRAIGVGIGLFIALVGLQGAKLIAASPVTLVTFGPLGRESLVALFGLAVMAFLMGRKAKGAILLGILAATAVAMGMGMTRLPTQWMSAVKPAFFASFFALDIPGVFRWSLVTTVFAFLITDFFDTMGTVVAVGTQAGFVTPEGGVPRLKRVLLVDSLAAVTGGLFGCSSVTTYIESAAGVGEGGRTGLASVVTGLLFLLAIFFAPVVGVIPACATAPALVMVGFLMMTVVKEIDWDEFSTAVPAFLTIIMIPFTYSISKGIGYGFISYALIKIGSGKFREVHPLLYLAALLFAVDFALTR